jgi:ureidoglycolate hydrolase
MKIKPKKITEENFSAFGKVVVGTSGIPTSQAADYKFWSDIMNYNIDGETEVGICTVYKQPTNSIYGMERHLNTPEILIPIDAPFILPLLKDKSKPEEAEAFVVDIGQAITIYESVWHGACIPFGKDECSYFVIFKRGTPHKDVEKIDLPEIIISS